jgi:anti-repressor protein
MIDASRNPIVQITDTREAMADSRDVAAYFGRNHAEVRRSIEILKANDLDWGIRNFADTPYVEPQNGQTYYSYRMTKTGFTMLAMGFTGAKAFAFKIKYIEAFDVMDAELQRRGSFAVPRTYVEALQVALDQARQIERQQAELVTLAPKGEFFDRFVNADGLYGYQNAARALNCRPNKFVDWLKGKYCFYAGDALLPYVQHLQADLFKVKSFIADDGKARQRGFITPKGLEYFSSRVPAEIKIGELV